MKRHAAVALLISIGLFVQAGTALAAVPPVNLVAPSISGTAAPGGMLHGQLGSWTGRGNSYTMQWERCNAAGASASCVSIPGATSSDYAVTFGDAGFTVLFAVSAWSGYGSNTAYSPTLLISSQSGAAGPGPTAPPWVRVNATTATSIGIGWGDATDNVGYAVYVNGNRVALTQAVSATVSGLSCGTSYTLSVDAYNGAGYHSTATAISAATTGCGTSPPPPPPPPGGGSGSIYWGAWIDGSVYGSSYGDSPWDTATTAIFEQHAGKPVSLIHLGQGWDTGGYWHDFPADALQRARDHGAIPLLDWASWQVPANNLPDPDFTNAQVASGRYDWYIRQWATDAKAWGYPFMLRFDWEMNGRWYPWGEGGNGNQPGDFVRMWRHVHDIFTSVGANNVTWVWCVNTVYPGSIPLAGLYPGDAYVDWTGFDAYNKNVPWTSSYDLYKPVYDEIVSVAPSKPMIIPETSSVEAGGSKAAWITDAISTLSTRFPKVKAYAWFNWNIDGGSNINDPNYAIESSASAQAAFAAAIGNSIFARNNFGSLPAGTKVQPLP